ncbi:sigma-70 family RNA polymerase sigma factor [Pontibacter sp. JH31]|uniref:Sigma-70 family RNA polymerase sigma factor n=1 Tax=Pontibacter aquaedesilientis TaxID=2766980 RepID=A0ABR7XFJ4_9BACT|nr:sigma-70 family RNA polymerase sigma factor [Pontibacter aquaedesilientis]
MARLRDRDNSAMSTLYDMYSATLYGIVLQIVKIEETAEDVLQDALVKIWNSFDKYDPDKGRLFTWMLNICRNQAIDAIRSKQHRVSNKTEDFSANIRSGLSSEDFKPEHIGVRDMIDNLTPDQKQVIDLMYFEGLSQSEIADAYNIPLGTVKTRARSAVKMLSKFFKGRA